MHLFFAIVFTLVFSFKGIAQVTDSEFDKAMEINGGSSQIDAQKMIELLEQKYPDDGKVLFLRGMYHFRDGNSNMAMMSFTNAIKLLPKFAMAYNGRAILFEQKGLLEKSIDDFTKSIEINSVDADIYGKRADLFFQLKEFQKALVDYDKQIQLAPSGIMGYYNAANTSISLGKASEADQYFAKAYAAKGMQAFVVNALFGKFLVLQKRYPEAMEKYELALKEAESQFGDEDFNMAAIAFYKNQQFDKAIIYANKAIALQPANIDYKCNLASIYVDKKDWQQVMNASQAGLNVDPNHAMANMYMAVALTKLGRDTEAQPYLIKAKQ